MSYASMQAHGVRALKDSPNNQQASLTTPWLLNLTQGQISLFCLRSRRPSSLSSFVLQELNSRCRNAKLGSTGLRCAVEKTVTKESLGCCLPCSSRQPKSTKHVERTLSTSLDQSSILCGSTKKWIENILNPFFLNSIVARAQRNGTHFKTLLENDFRKFESSAIYLPLRNLLRKNLTHILH